LEDFEVTKDIGFIQSIEHKRSPEFDDEVFELFKKRYHID